MFTLVSWSPSLPNPLRCLRIRTWPVCLQSWHVMRPPRLAGGQCGGGPFKFLYPSNMVGHCSSQIWWDWGQPCRIYYSNIRSGCPHKKLSDIPRFRIESFGSRLNISQPIHHFPPGCRRCSHCLGFQGGWVDFLHFRWSFITSTWERFHGFAVNLLDLAAKGVQEVS